jgi:acetyltransferase-like isoleucine patch superfamily enzyme
VTSERSAGAPGRVPPARGPGLPVRPVAAQALGYLTNHMVNRLPSHGLRRLWYRRAVGIDMGEGAAILLGLRLWLYGRGQARRRAISIGTGTRINRDCCLDIRGGLRIGNHVSISPEVAILTADHDRDDPAFPLRHRPVVIEDHVWIGMRATVLPGVTIGRGAVVAAGAVVTRDVEPLTIVAGTPARVVGRRNPAALGYDLGRPPLFE